MARSRPGCRGARWSSRASLWFVAVAGGLALFVVPGLAALLLFSLTGPVLVREDLGAVAGMRRSAGLVRRRPGLVMLTVVIPFVAELYVADLAAELFGHSVVVELVVEVLASLFLASFVGLLEVVTAHQLVVTEAHRPRPPGRSPGSGRCASPTPRSGRLGV